MPDNEPPNCDQFTSGNSPYADDGFDTAIEEKMEYLESEEAQSVFIEWMAASEDAEITRMYEELLLKCATDLIERGE